MRCFDRPGWKYGNGAYNMAPEVGVQNSWRASILFDLTALWWLVVHVACVVLLGSAFRIHLNTRNHVQ